MRKHLTIATSVLLLASFAIFTMGMPVYSYLCPMMSNANPVCDMWSQPSAADNAVTNQMASCCAKVLVADRNTTPFLKNQDVTAGFENLSTVTVLVQHTDPQDQIGLKELLDAGVCPVEHSPPIFLLHSSFLL